MVQTAAGIVSLDIEWGDPKTFLLDVQRSPKGLYVKITEADWPPMVRRSLIFGE